LKAKVNRYKLTGLLPPPRGNGFPPMTTERILFMKISTRDKLRDIALANNRSDSNMVEYLIDSYPKEQNESKKDNASGIRSEQEVEK